MEGVSHLNNNLSVGRRGSGEAVGTTEPRLEEYCVHSLFRIPYGKSTGKKTGIL